MLDIRLCAEGKNTGDIELTSDGDIQLIDSLIQNARVAILWILDEWRLGPDIGLPWFDDILVHNPHLDLISQEIRDALLEINGIRDAEVEVLEFNQRERTIKFRFKIISAEGENYSEEVVIGG